MDAEWAATVGRHGNYQGGRGSTYMRYSAFLNCRALLCQVRTIPYRTAPHRTAPYTAGPTSSSNLGSFIKHQARLSFFHSVSRLSIDSIHPSPLCSASAESIHNTAVHKLISYAYHILLHGPEHAGSTDPNSSTTPYEQTNWANNQKRSRILTCITLIPIPQYGSMLTMNTGGLSRMDHVR